MKSIRSMTLVLAGVLGAPVLSFAEPKLKIGDSAPALKIGEWVQGEPVKEFSKDNVYVVEFWATWCGPCVSTIPHLDALHEELKDKNVIFIGQNCLEDDTDEVKSFVKNMGEKMSYRVATDDTSTDSDGFMAENWIEAAEEKGIPCAFVVGKDGRIAWIGHPAELNADLLKQVVAGTFDVKKAAETRTKTIAAQEIMKKSGAKLHKAIRTMQWDEAVQILDGIEKEHPDIADHLLSARLFVGAKSGNSTMLLKCAEKALSGPMADEPQALNQVAWGIATGLKNPSKEALDIAEKAAVLAVEKSQSSDAAILDTLARVQFLQGKKEEAVKTQEQAVSKANQETKEEVEKNLESYKAGKLPPADEEPGEIEGNEKEAKEIK